MKKLAVLVLSLALAAAACAGGDAVVATVNGTDITLAEVEGLRPPTATVARQDFADDLFQLIVEELVRQGGAELGVVDDQAAVDAFYNDYVAGIEGQQTLAEFLEANNITEDTLRHFAFQQVYFPEVQAKILDQAGPISEEAIQGAYDQLAATDKTEVCTHHILVASEEEAQTVLDRLQEEDFAALAGELSLDTGSGANGGDVGCGPASQYDPVYGQAALEAPIGDVTGPVQSSFGFHVLIVDSRRDLSLEDLRDQLEQQLSSDQAGTLVNDWFLGKIEAADVVVGEAYGVWQTDPPGVVAPTG